MTRHRAQRTKGKSILKRAEQPSAAAIAVQHPHRFVTLDLLRGVAAVIVVYFHTYELFGTALHRRGIFQHGYLAVDFFFMLSGFVMTSAYGNKLDTGWPTFTFMKARFARLYPLYLFGLVLANLYIVLFHLFHGRHHFEPDSVRVFLLGLALIPTLSGAGGPESFIYPTNTPAWSLFFELVANLFHALALRRRSRRALMAVIGVSALALIACVLHRHKLDLGHTRETFYYGFVRVLFPYTTGILLFKLWRRRAIRFHWPAAASVLLLVVLLGCPVSPSFGGIYDLGVTLVGFPLLLSLSASAVPPRSLVGASLLLGNASYAIYVLHVPAFAWMELLSRMTGLRYLHTPWLGILNLFALLALSLLADRYYDLPARAFLRKSLKA